MNTDDLSDFYINNLNKTLLRFKRFFKDNNERN